MLPRLDRLRLRDDTGEFLVLDQAAVADLNARDVLDPISMERPIHQGTFRVQMRTPSPDGAPRYSYWKPEDLWNWVRRPESNGRMPDTNEKIWYEDWWALYYTYGPTPTVPVWARSLDKREAFTQPAQGGNAGGGPFSDWMRTQPAPPTWAQGVRAPSSDANEEVRRANERVRLEQLQRGDDGNLFGVAQMTGLNGRFWLTGRAAYNPSAAQIIEGVRERIGGRGGFANALWVEAIEVNLDVSDNPVRGWWPRSSSTWATMIRYEFNGLTDVQTQHFLEYAEESGGMRNQSGQTPRGEFYKEFFALPTTPIVQDDDLPAIGLFGLGGRLRPAAHLQLSPSAHEAWVESAQRERE
jgi:hypothetical protein